MLVTLPVHLFTEDHMVDKYMYVLKMVSLKINKSIIIIIILLLSRLLFLHILVLTSIMIEPRHEKTCLRGFRPGKTQTGLRSHRS